MMVEHLLDARIDRLAQGGVLGREVVHRNRHGHASGMQAPSATW